MALLEKDRHTIYTAFVPLLGEEATQAMLSQFPARDMDEPITKEYLRAEMATLKSDIESTLTTRMIAIAGIGLGAITALLAVFT